MTFSAAAGSVGLRGSYDIATDFGTLTPTARVEYRQTRQSAYSQSMFYNDLGPGENFVFTQNATSFGMATGTLGLRLRSLAGLEADVEYGLSEGTSSLQMQTFRGTLRVPF